ncbi:hypothetical protein P19_0396 [Aeromonas phage P19]|nr:hypothetical protein P19_0396 [Aeromonas phage P19]
MLMYNKFKFKNEEAMEKFIQLGKKIATRKIIAS